VDLLFDGPRVMVECDGDRYHGTRLARADDARRQAKLEAGGYRVLRVTWEQVVHDQ
jgi:very-short-patch-repair endonuclease